MAGTINSLGIGSGVLTSDVIDKLKANDKSLIIDPIDNKITLNTQKSDALSLLTSLMSSFKASVSALADDTAFAKRSVSGNTDGISVTADPGVAVQSFSISDTSLAKQNVLEAAGFSASDETIASGDGILNINSGGTDYQIHYDNTTTLEDLRDTINTQAGDAVRASILQTDDESYSLVLTSQETGKEQTVSLSDLSGNLKSGSSLTSSGFLSDSFASSTTKIATTGGSGTLDLTLGDTTYQFAYDDTTTLSQLSDAINNDATLSGNLHASVVKYGDGDYRLSLTPRGAANGEEVVLTQNGTGLNAGLVSDALVSSASFASKDTAIATDGTPDSTGNFRVTIDGSDYDIAYDETTTLQNLADAINAHATLSSQAKASIVQFGTNDYRLVLSNTATSQGQSISTSDQASTGSGLVAGVAGGSYIDGAGTLNEGGVTIVQDAKDATFKYNGITVTRSTNEIDDIISGVTMNLLQDDASSNIAITQDSSAVSDELETLVNSYNALMSQLNSMTTSDADAGTVGIFNGDSSINGIRREINKIITTYDENAFSLTQFGIDLKQDGTMTYDSSKFYAKFDEDPMAAQKFFSGETIVDDNGLATYVNGIFDNLDDLLNNYTKSNGYLANLSDGFTEEATSLQENRKRSMALLEARYDAMTQQFIEYDSIINKLNNQFTVLDNMIKAELNAK
jgi:flagellar hook-associated protein 2